MRKRLKNKKSVCALCKPHKRGWDHRWKAKDLSRLKAAEKNMRQSVATLQASPSA